MGILQAFLHCDIKKNSSSFRVMSQEKYSVALLIMIYLFSSEALCVFYNIVSGNYNWKSIVCKDKRGVYKIKAL